MDVLVQMWDNKKMFVYFQDRLDKFHKSLKIVKDTAHSMFGLSFPSHKQELDCVGMKV